MAALAAAAILWWLASVFLVVSVQLPTVTVKLWFGALDVMVARNQSESGLSAKIDSTPPRYLPSGRARDGGPGALFPLWIPAALLVWPGLKSIRRLWTVPQGHCRICRYDLHGNVSGQCPECGAAVEPAG